jgi:hypothetical protein
MCEQVETRMSNADRYYTTQCRAAANCPTRGASTKCCWQRQHPSHNRCHIPTRRPLLLTIHDMSRRGCSPGRPPHTQPVKPSQTHLVTDLVKQGLARQVLQDDMEPLIILKHLHQLRHVGVAAQGAHGGNLVHHGCGGG